MRLALDEGAGVDRPVGIARRTLAEDFPLDPVAGIFIAVRQLVGALAVLLAVLERAFVDAAVIVFLGDDILRQRTERGEKQRRRDQPPKCHPFRPHHLRPASIPP